MSEFGYSGFLSNCTIDNSETLNKFLLGSTAKSIYNPQIKLQQNTDDLHKINLELQQKISLLEKEKNEMIEREANLKKINEQIMEAFNSLGSDPSKEDVILDLKKDERKRNLSLEKKQLLEISKIFMITLYTTSSIYILCNIKIMIQRAIILYDNRIKQTKKQRFQRININKKQILLRISQKLYQGYLNKKYQNQYLKLKKKQLSSKISFLENENQTSKIQIEHLKVEKQKSQHLLDLQNSKYETLLKTAESEKRNLQDQIENQWKKKIEILESQLEKEKLEQNNQRQVMLKEMETNLENLKLYHEHEKHLLWTKVSGLQNERNVIQGSCEQNQDLYNELKKRNKEDRDSYMKEVEGLKNKISQLEQENLKIQHFELLQSQHENQLKQKELAFDEERKKYNTKIRDLNLQVKKQEQVEKNLSTLLKEKDFIIEDNKKEHLKKLYLEKKKSENLQEAANKIKEDYTKKNAYVIQEILTKEEHIKKLNKEIMKQGVSMSKMSQSKNNMTTWFDPLNQVDTCRLTSQGNNLNMNSILNQDTIPDMNLLSNNVPSITNNNTFLQEFALSFGSPRNIIGLSPNQVDEKYLKLLEQQQYQQQLLNQSGQSQNIILSGRNQTIQNSSLMKQSSSPILNDTIESVHGNSILNRHKESKHDLIKKEDKIQETQNESEDPSFDRENMENLETFNQQKSCSGLHTKYPSQVNFCQMPRKTTSYTPTSYNTAPNSFRQALNSNNRELKQQLSQDKLIPQTTKSKQQTDLQRCQTVSTAKKKQNFQSKQSEEKTPNTSVNINKGKSVNTSTSSKTQVISSNKKENIQPKQINSQQYPFSSNIQHNQNNQLSIQTQYYSNDVKDTKRNFSQSSHISSPNINNNIVNNQIKQKLQTPLHKNSISTLDIFKKDQSQNLSSTKNVQDQFQTTPSQQINYHNYSQIQNYTYQQNNGCQLLNSPQSYYTNIIGNQQQNITLPYQYNSCNVNIQNINDKQNITKNISNDSLYSYQYNTNQTNHEQSQQQHTQPQNVNDCNILQSTLLMSTMSTKNQTIPTRQSNMFKQAELYSHLNSLIEMLKKKLSGENNSLSIQELNYVQSMIQQQQDDFTVEEISKINQLLAINNIKSILLCFEKIKNRIIDNRGYCVPHSKKQQLKEYDSNKLTSKYGNQKNEGSDIFERLYRNVQNQISINHQLQTENSDICATLQTLPNEFYNEIPGCINPVRASDAMKTNIRSSSTFTSNQSSSCIPSCSNIQQPLQNITNKNSVNTPTVRNIYLN